MGWMKGCMSHTLFGTVLRFLSCYRMAWKPMYYFWNFQFNIFRLQLMVKNWGMQNLRLGTSLKWYLVWSFLYVMYSSKCLTCISSYIFFTIFLSSFYKWEKEGTEWSNSLPYPIANDRQGKFEFRWIASGPFLTFMSVDIIYFDTWIPFWVC